MRIVRSLNNNDVKRVALIRHTLPLIIFVEIVPQALATSLYFSDGVALKVFSAALVAIASYYVFFFLARRVFNDFSIDPIRSVFITPAVIVCLFLLAVAVLAVTSSDIALLSSLRGADEEALFNARTAFTKGRSGMELVFVYAYAMILKGALPIALMLLFDIRHRRRWIFLGLVLFALLLSLEKFLTAMILIPIGLYYYLIDQKKRLLFFVLIGFMFLTLASMLSGAGSVANGQLKQSSPNIMAAVYRPVTAIEIKDSNIAGKFNALNSLGRFTNVSLSNEDNYRFFLGSSGAPYFINRVIWIPFVTSYDALKYWQNFHDETLLFGATSSPVASMFGLTFVNIEQQVFAYQYGSSEDDAGRSNTAFFIDSLINFGWLGVVVSAATCGLLFGWFSRCTHPAFAAATCVTAYSLANNSLLPMIWSGGILLLIILTLMWRSVDKRSSTN